MDENVPFVFRWWDSQRGCTKTPRGTRPQGGRWRFHSLCSVLGQTLLQGIRRKLFNANSFLNINIKQLKICAYQRPGGHNGNQWPTLTTFLTIKKKYRWGPPYAPEKHQSPLITEKKCDSISKESILTANSIKPTCHQPLSYYEWDSAFDAFSISSDVT